LRCSEFAEMQYTIEETLQTNCDMSAAQLNLSKVYFALPEIQQRLFYGKTLQSTDFFFGRF